MKNKGLKIFIVILIITQLSTMGGFGYYYKISKDNKKILEKRIIEATDEMNDAKNNLKEQENELKNVDSRRLENASVAYENIVKLEKCYKLLIKLGYGDFVEKLDSIHLNN